MTSAQQQAILRGTNCEVAFDNLTRQLYATDASIYQVEPVAVAFPRTVRQVTLLVDAAIQAGLSIIPRGAGTGLTGGAIGEGLVIDFARYNRDITELDLERHTVRVQPGVVLDQLNAFLRPHGFRFGPDVATSSRATLGGMIANNSSGSHTPYYGTTTNHLCELEIVMADSRSVMVGKRHDTLRKQRELVADLGYFHSLDIQERLGPGLLKRRPGYDLHGCLSEPDNLNHLICGSEGTLALITSAELRIVPLPAQKGLGLIFFSSVAEAMQATVELLDLKPAAIEHMDRVLLDQTRGQLEFQAARDLLELDFKPCQAVLAVEFFDDVADRLAALARRNLGLRTLILKSPREANLVWALRKAGLSLLTGRKGDAKPVTCIEDVAVRPRDLPHYVSALQSIIVRLGLEASYYGHAAAGLLHVRPILDLHEPEGVQKLRAVSNEVSALVRQFGGSLAGEHGVGIARSEFMAEEVGENLLAVMAEIKTAFDPNNLFNPGKIIPDGRYTIDTNLRITPGRDRTLPFAPVLAFSAKDESFLANLEQCNGCGGCRKETPVMCPTFLVTGDELLSTRGRANLLRAALEGRGLDRPASSLLRNDLFDAALNSCLGCRACVSECPSNVNMALLKTELLHARAAAHGLSLRQRVFSSVDILGRLGTMFPWPANAALNSQLVRRLLARLLGLAPERPLPNYTRHRFDRWFAKHRPPSNPTRGSVILWDDTFVRYHEPHIGIAAVKVLEAAGFEVRLVRNRKCCGRPAFSQGHLAEARRLALYNTALLNSDERSLPILFLEPSCYSMMVEEYKELRVAGADRVAARCFLFEQFIERLLSDTPGALHFRQKTSNVLIHAHCHMKSMMSADFLRTLGHRLPGRSATLLDSACCGMAGAFGALASNYELSVKVGEPLAKMIQGQPFGTSVVASGTSCRQQIHHLTGVRAKHMAELLADALQPEVTARRP